MIGIDKTSSQSCALNQLKLENLLANTIHLMNKYLNNIIEKEHQHVNKK
ncbi:hypothetical protein IV491_16045 [Enterococcus casseliflavus]|nr:hypothetical protein [Enterococcus casseliflavus]